MKRLASCCVLLIFGCLVTIPLGVFAHDSTVVIEKGPISKNDKEWYVGRGLVHHGSDFHSVLVEAGDGVWSASIETTIEWAKRAAIRGCKSISLKPATCKIVDIDAKSDWIGSSTSSSYASSSSSNISAGKVYMWSVWCADTSGVEYSRPDKCKTNGGEWFYTRSEAVAEHRRLNLASSSSTASSLSSNAMVWCVSSPGSSVFRIHASGCNADGGAAYSTEALAKAAHRRLNGYTSFVSSSSSDLLIGNAGWCVSKIGVAQETEKSCQVLRGEWYSEKEEAIRQYDEQQYGKVWCVTKDSVWAVTQKAICGAHNGRVYMDKFAAESQHRRLGDEAKRTPPQHYCHHLSSNSFYWMPGPCPSGWWVEISAEEYYSLWCVVQDLYPPLRRSDPDSCVRDVGGKIFGTKARAEAAYAAYKEVPKKDAPEKVTKPTVITAKLTIRSNVRGDRVYIDGKYKGSTRLDLDLSKGRHTIRIEKDGYKTYEEQIDLSNALTLRASLEKIAEKPVQTADKSSLELEFWQTIKGSDDPDMYREYLRQFPEGVYAGLAKLKIKKLGGTSVAKSSIPNLDYGRYHALVIGNDRYRHLKKLSTAVNDAEGIAAVLKSDYGFEVNLLTNATRDETLKAFSRLRKTVTPNDNLLIYYAGHGWLDKGMDEGFWLPVDATEDDPIEWVSNATVVGMVRAMKAKHVMVVADSCFSGTLVRGLKIKERSPNYIQRMVKKKARTALTSGGLEPVTDVGGGNHSVFAQSFMRILNENDGVLDGHQLFTTLRRQVMMGADQTPEYGDIRKAGHDGGDFLFVRQ